MYWQRPHPSSSFVELRCEKSTLICRWGRIDTAGSERSEAHPSAEEASLACARQVRRLEGKGYVAGHHNLDLIQAIERTPEDAGAYQVYADWLLERQDPRGMLIRLLAENRQTDADLWLHDHAEQLFPRWWAQHAAFDWRLGFLSRIHLHAHVSGDAPWLLRRMLVHPTARFVRELVIDGWISPSLLADLWRDLLSARRSLIHTVRLPRSPGLWPLVGIIPGLVKE